MFSLLHCEYKLNKQYKNTESRVYFIEIYTDAINICCLLGLFFKNS